MTGHRRVKRRLRGVCVPNLADENDIRILPQDRAKRLRKCQPGFFIHLNLADSVDFVLDRILDRDDVERVGPDLVDAGVKRGRLSTAGRTHSQKHSLWTSNQRVQTFLDGRLKADLRKRQERTAAPQ